ncbi:hypothetical protein WJX73_002998 [Symbiochloris irregularis]|uniref:Uncharacterized protein n=1 Tax=Symbiochloris irregularis TaxID=706552 RepID=A0AAW1P300_9CHLO
MANAKQVNAFYYPEEPSGFTRGMLVGFAEGSSRLVVARTLRKVLRYNVIEIATSKTLFSVEFLRQEWSTVAFSPSCRTVVLKTHDGAPPSKAAYGLMQTTTGDISHVMINPNRMFCAALKSASWCNDDQQLFQIKQLGRITYLLLYDVSAVRQHSSSELLLEDDVDEYNWVISAGLSMSPTGRFFVCTCSRAGSNIKKLAIFDMRVPYSLEEVMAHCRLDPGPLHFSGNDMTLCHVTAEGDCTIWNMSSFLCLRSMHLNESFEVPAAVMDAHKALLVCLNDDQLSMVYLPSFQTSQVNALHDHEALAYTWRTLLAPPQKLWSTPQYSLICAHATKVLFVGFAPV